MKRDVLTILLTIMIVGMGIFNWETDVKAETIEEDIDISCVMTDDAIVGYAQNQTWGVYLSEGYSVINKISTTKVGAGGVTNASKKCTVSINTILERKNNSGNWARVTSWTVSNSSAYSAIVSKSVTVASGYYYRVRSYHDAGTDSSSSCTSGLWIGN